VDVDAEIDTERRGRSFFLLAFGAAALCLIALVCGLAWRSGALATPSGMAIEQTENPRVLAFPPDIVYFGALKIRRAALVRPDVVVIGSSRCNELRARMMRPYRFYNACLTAWTFDQMIRALDDVTRVASPRVVVFTMDFSMFSRAQEDNFGARNYDPREGWGYGTTAMRSLLTGLASRRDIMGRDWPAALSGTAEEPFDGLIKRGAAALWTDAGFRSDGSFLHPRGMYRSSEEANRDPRNDMQPRGPRLDERYLDDLRKMRDLAASRGAVLVGIQFPFLKTSVDVMDGDDPAKYGVWRDFEKAETRERFRSIGVPFFDLARTALTADSRNFIDPSHPNEAGMLGSLLILAENEAFRTIFRELDVDGLRNDYRSAMTRNEFTDIYRDEF